jgi:hypothetical protein
MPSGRFDADCPTGFVRGPLVAAIVDRVTFNAHITETGTNSYRLRTTRTRTGAKTRARPGANSA